MDEDTAGVVGPGPGDGGHRAGLDHGRRRRRVRDRRLGDQGPPPADDQRRRAPLAARGLPVRPPPPGPRRDAACCTRSRAARSPRAESAARRARRARVGDDTRGIARLVPSARGRRNAPEQARSCVALAGCVDAASQTTTSRPSRLPRWLRDVADVGPARRSVPSRRSRASTRAGSRASNAASAAAHRAERPPRTWSSSTGSPAEADPAGPMARQHGGYDRDQVAAAKAGPKPPPVVGVRSPSMRPPRTSHVRAPIEPTPSMSRVSSPRRVTCRRAARIASRAAPAMAGGVIRPRTLGSPAREEATWRRRTRLPGLEHGRRQPTRPATASRPRARRRSADRTGGPRPEPSLRILETRVLRGPNYWAREPVIRQVVDLGVLEEFPSNKIPGFVDALVGMLPTLEDHACSPRPARRVHHPAPRGHLGRARVRAHRARVPEPRRHRRPPRQDPRHRRVRPLQRDLRVPRGAGRDRGRQGGRRARQPPRRAERPGRAPST